MDKIRSTIQNYTIDTPNGPVSGQYIIYLDNNNEEITREEYYGNTGEEWVNSHLSSLEIIGLQRLEFNILNTGKTIPPKMLAMKNWLETILIISSIDPGKKTNWNLPPYTYIETAQEAVNILNT
jgi:hypothetical protein